jgi:hypothetical protein
MDDRDVSDGDAPGQGQKDVPPSFHPDASTRSRDARSPGEPREAAEGGFLGGGNARPVHRMARIPFQDVMAQRGVCSKGRTPHPMVNISRVEGRAVVALHGRGVGRQHADAKVVAEASADFSALEFQRLGEGKGVQPCRGRASRTAEQAGASTPPFCGVGVEGFQQGVGLSLCRVPRELALCCGNSSQAFQAHLLILWRPQSASPIM